MLESMMRSQVILMSGLFMLVAATPAAAQRTFDTNILAETFGFDDSTPKEVNLDDLHQGCPARDCFASIDNPKYVEAGDAGHVSDEDVVLALSMDGEHRAWPARILDHHEIVNDTIAGVPVAITWCPLCGSAVGIIREVDGQVTEFGVSGVLYNSDLVIYDRTTETLWDQIEAKGIVGPLTGTELELVPVTMTRWGKWKDAHPDTLVLSDDTGFGRDYTQDRYQEYRGSGNLIFPVARNNDTIHPKSVVFGFVVDDRKIAVTEELLTKSAGLTHSIDGRDYRIALADDGVVSMTDTESGESHAPTRLYWFAWYTFHPETELVR
jgi:hypothetical protein